MICCHHCTISLCWYYLASLKLEIRITVFDITIILFNFCLLAKKASTLKLWQIAVQLYVQLSNTFILKCSWSFSLVSGAASVGILSCWKKGCMFYILLDTESSEHCAFIALAGHRCQHCMTMWDKLKVHTSSKFYQIHNMTLYLNHPFLTMDFEIRPWCSHCFFMSRYHK